MFCGAKEAGGVYRPRHPQESPFYQLVERFYPEFEAVYEERYQERYGFWRPIIGTVVRKFLECGDLKQGFARVRCPKCREELYSSMPIHTSKTGLRSGPNLLSQVWYDDAHRHLHRAAPDQGHREDSPALRTVGRALSSRPARGEGPGYGLRLRTRGTGGAAASRARRGIRSTVNCTLDGQRQPRFQPLSPSERPCWRLRPPLGAGGRPPTSPQRPTRHLAADNSAAFRLEWPPRARHTPAASKKQMPMCSLRALTYLQVQVLPRQWMVGPSSDSRLRVGETPTGASSAVNGRASRWRKLPARTGQPPG